MYVCPCKGYSMGIKWKKKSPGTEVTGDCETTDISVGS